MTKLLYEEESYDIRGACFEVYKDKGHDFLESVYQECMEIEFEERGIPFELQPKLKLNYKSHSLKTVFVPDFVCYGKIIVELKAVSAVDDIHRAQVHNYLKATEHRLGFLVNFGHHPKIEIERIVN